MSSNNIDIVTYMSGSSVHHPWCEAHFMGPAGWCLCNEMLRDWHRVTGAVSQKKYAHRFYFVDVCSGFAPVVFTHIIQYFLTVIVQSYNFLHGNDAPF